MVDSLQDGGGPDGGATDNEPGDGDAEHTMLHHDIGDDQVTRALDPDDAAEGANQSPAEMGIDVVTMFSQALEQTRMAIAISDAHEPDQPLVYVNQAFERLTGYSREESVGRNCRFLQGPDTDPAIVQRIREGLERREVFVVELKNYRKDGSEFWNTLHVGPIVDANGEITHFYGSQWDVTSLVEARERRDLDARIAQELRHRTGNLFAVITSILHLSARGAQGVDDLVERVDGRVRALATAHQLSIASEGKGDSDLHELVGAVLRPYRAREGARIELGGPSVVLPVDALTPLGITLHELATNALKYGALGDPEGAVRVAWEKHGGRLQLEWTETGPRALAEPASVRGGTGSKLMRALLAAANGSTRTERDAAARRILVEMDIG